MAIIKSRRGGKQVPDNINYNPKLISPDLNIKNFNTIVWQKGVKANVYKVVPCPNVHSIDGHEHDINCSLCEGTGFIDIPNPIETIVLIYNQGKDLNKNPENLGSEVEEGVVNMTFLSGINLTYFSRIDLLDFSRPYYQMVQRQNGNADRLYYPAIAIDFLIDKNGIQYHEGIDFEIQEGMIKWLQNSPSVGTIYSIHYQCRVSFRCISALHQGRYSTFQTKQDQIDNIEHSEQWKAKLDYLVVQRKNSGEIIKNNLIYAPGE